MTAEEPACIFCFFSLPTTGYLYSLRGGVELLSTYHYPDKVLEAMLTDYLLHAITKYDGGLCLQPVLPRFDTNAHLIVFNLARQECVAVLHCALCSSSSPDGGPLH